MDHNKPASHLLSILALTGACALWGTSFASMKICGEILNRGAPAAPGVGAFGFILFTAVRFTIGVVLTLLVWPSARRIVSRADWPLLLKVALPMAAGFLLQAAGLSHTTATISGFITGMCVCFTPLAEWLLLRKRPTRALALAVTLALVGAGLMAFKKGEALGFGPGEILTFLCVLAYTIQIVYTGAAADRLGPGPLTAYSFAIIAAAAWILSALMAPTGLLPALSAAAADGRFWQFLLLVLLLATLGAQILMNSFQRFVRPSEAAVVYTSEPVFAGLFAVLFIGWSEFPGRLGILGAVLMLAANLVVAAKPSRQDAGRPTEPAPANGGVPP